MGAPPAFDVVVAGAGLAGLTAAYVLSREKAELRILVVEASSRIGGRVYSAPETGVDLGPAWVWLSSMPRMHELIKELGLDDRLVKQPGGDGEHRLQGGLSMVIDRLHAALAQRPQVVVELGRRVRRAVQSKPAEGAIVQVTTAQAVDGGEDERVDECLHLLLALPPSRVAEDIELVNCGHFLPDALLEQMKRQPVWMAPMGKLALYYESRFWDPAQVYGGMRAAGREDWYGAVQVYDAGQTVGGRDLSTLVCFVAFGGLLGRGGRNWDEQRANIEKAMAERAIEQLASGFSLPRAKLAAYCALDLSCWRADTNILSAEQARENFPEHPRPLPSLNVPADGRGVWFANAEAAPDHTGYMEGAVDAAERAARLVLKSLSS